MKKELVIVLDFGGQYNQLVARRVRECNVYCEIYSYKTDLEKIKHECPGLDSTLQASDIIDIDVSRYSNMRDINSEIMRQITDALYAQIVK